MLAAATRADFFSWLVRETGDACGRQPPGRDRRGLAKTEARGARLVAVAGPAEVLWRQQPRPLGGSGVVK